MRIDGRFTMASARCTALLPPPEERHRQRLLAREQADFVQRRAHAPADLVAREAASRATAAPRSRRRSSEEELVVLEDEADAPAQHRKRRLAERAEFCPFTTTLRWTRARCRGELEQRGLARAPRR